MLDSCRLLSQLVHFSHHRVTVGFPYPLPYTLTSREIGDAHQQWMLPHFRNIDHYSLSDSIYCSPRMAGYWRPSMIILLLYNYERAFYLNGVVVPSCWSEETFRRKTSIMAGLPKVLLAFSKAKCSSLTHWGLQMNLPSSALLVKELRVQSHKMLYKLTSQ